MPNLDLPILVVDDAKFSSMVVGRTLRNAGYRDIRIANNAPAALKLMEERPVSVLIADWLMPEMDGLELTDQVRQLDEQTNHYTYVILLTARESVEALQNTLLRANALLVENNRELESSNIIDMETGLCNAKYARQRLQKILRHAESRGGASAYVMCGIRNWQDLKRKHPPSVMSELAIGIARRLNSLIRPIDALCRIGDNQFVIVSYFPNSDHCTPTAFRRIFDGINHKALKTTAGYISVEAGMALCRASAEEGTPSVQDMEKASIQGLIDAYETRRFVEITPEIREGV